MFEVRITKHFSAAHRLLEHQGKCKNLHGHNWDVTLMVRSSELDRIGMAVDFSQLKQMLDEILSPYDHQYLNELPEFSGVESNPTAERIAQHIYVKANGMLRSLAPHARVDRVEVFETGTCSASYFE